MNKLSLIVAILLITQVISAQTIRDSEFRWVKTENCQASEKSIIFKKVEIDPKITSFNTKELKAYLKDKVSLKNIQKEQRCTLKLKVQFIKNKGICLYAVGMQNVILDDDQIGQLESTIHNMAKFEAGRQRNKEVNCEGIIYLNLIEGKVENIRCVNIATLKS